MGKSIGIIAIKGGVGKTTISASLAADLVNHYKKDILLVDGNYSAPNLGLHMDIIDPDKTIHDVLSGKARISSAVQKKYGVDVVPGSYVYYEKFNPLKLRDRISKVKDNYDFTIIDSSPTLNDEVLSTMLASDLIFVVSTPDYPTLSCSLRAAKLAKQRGKPIAGIIINKIRDPAYELTLNEIEESTRIPVMLRIPDDKINVRALFSRIPTSIYNRRAKFSREISKLSSTLINKKENKGFVKKILPFNFGKDEVNRQLFREGFYTSYFSN